MTDDKGDRPGNQQHIDKRIGKLLDEDLQYRVLFLFRQGISAKLLMPVL